MTNLDWSATPHTPLVVNGATLEYACYGPRPDQAPTFILLHEGLGCTALWRDFPKRLADQTGLGVLVYSRQGYGQSDPAELPRPLDFMTREAVDVLPRILDQAGIGQAILVGHSDGASIAAIYCGSVLDHRVRGLVLMAPHFFTESVGLHQIEQAKVAFETGDLKNKLAKYHRNPENAFCGWVDTWLNPDFKSWDIADVIDYFRIPVLAIQGRDDQYGTLAQIDEIVDRAYAPVDTVILEDCKHTPQQDKPEEVLAAVADFAARLQRIEAAEVEIA